MRWIRPFHGPLEGNGAVSPDPSAVGLGSAACSTGESRKPTREALVIRANSISARELATRVWPMSVMARATCGVVAPLRRSLMVWSSSDCSWPMPLVSGGVGWVSVVVVVMLGFLDFLDLLVQLACEFPHRQQVDGDGGPVAAGQLCARDAAEVVDVEI